MICVGLTGHRVCIAFALRLDYRFQVFLSQQVVGLNSGLIRQPDAQSSHCDDTVYMNGCGLPTKWRVCDVGDKM